jgi:hypothetical protein
MTGNPSLPVPKTTILELDDCATARPDHSGS